MFKLINVTLGSDPEFAVVDRNGIPKSVVGLLGGTKQKPTDIGNGCGSQEDNVGAEITIPPTNNRQEFIDSIMYGKNTCTEILQEKGYDLHLESASSFVYNKKELNSRAAMEFGCDPSFCIYTKDISHRPDPEEIGNLRSFGFHIHIGFNGIAEIDTIENIIKAMDIYCGIPSIIIDNDTERRKLYGNAGDFRFKHLPEKNITIVEYRTLGGNMHKSEELIGYVFDQTQKAIDIVNNWGEYEKDIENNLDIIQDTIDNGNIEKAKELCEYFKIEPFKTTVYAENIEQASFA